LQGILSFKDLKSVQDSKGFNKLKKFKLFTKFKGFLSYLYALSYYKDFRVLLCSSCKIAISSANFKGYLAKHSLDLKGKVKGDTIRRATSILQELEVSSLSLSLDLITSFSTTHTLFPFPKLGTLNSLHKCAFCLYIVKGKKVIQKHLKEEHSYLKVSKLSKSYIVVAKGQCLEPKRYYFQVKTRDKGKQAQRGEEGEEEEEELHSPLSASLDLEEEDPFAQASRLFLKEFYSKKEALFSNSTRYSLSKEECLSPLQKKTRYLQFLNNKNLQSFALLSSPYKEDKEPLLSILVMNLKELLYLSLDKSRYINNVLLQHLNSFQRGVVRNKPFKPLLRSKSCTKYFNFFGCFLAFVFRSFYNNKYKEDKLYSLSKESKGLLKELKQLALMQQEKAASADLDLNKDF
jgi:Orsellinic acid/F9775 biosynthesis cluster protein D